VEKAALEQVTGESDDRASLSANRQSALVTMPGAKARRRARQGAAALRHGFSTWISWRRRSSAGKAVLGLQIATGILVAIYFASTVVRARNTTSSFYDGWIGNLGYAGCAVLCAWRAVSNRRQRLAWAAIALSLGLFNIGAVLWTTTVQFWNPVPYPSIADLFFLLFYPVAYVGVGLLVRAGTPRLSGTIWLDGLIAALGVAALESTLVIGHISYGSRGNFATVATNLAYPIGDLVLVMMLIVVFAVRGWRPGPLWWTLGAGFGIFAMADTVYVLRVTSGTYVTGTPLDSVWLIGTFLIAIAAWAPREVRRDLDRQEQPVVVPALFLLSSLALVTVDAVWKVLLPLGVILAIFTLLAAIGRLGRAYRQLRLLAETKREARTDELTGLWNRRLFFETLQACVAEGGGSADLAVLMVDLDRFKEINDSLGHQVGDGVLRQLAPRFTAVVGSAGILARLGGDEFGVIVTPLASVTEATLLAERIRHALTQPLSIARMSMRVDASIGIAVCPEHGNTAQVLLQKADVAMYEAKRNHRGWELYASGRDIHTRQRFELLAQLPGALARRELVLYYQPQLDLETSTVLAVEALVRWQHPRHGLLTPDKFIGLAEHTGLIDDLTMYVLDQAVSQQAHWARDGLELDVAVNVSTTNLRDEGLPDKVNEVLLRRGVAPSRLTVEITETSLMTDPGLAIQVLGRLQQLGAHIAVDDYGTGFASLAYLRELPVDELKLDRSFLAGIPGDAKALAIVRSTIELAHTLGLRIVTEGVETQEALDLITALGCDAAQGYLIGYPAPASELANSLGGLAPAADWRRRSPRPRETTGLAHGDRVVRSLQSLPGLPGLQGSQGLTAAQPAAA
jgi:diguanylate cyclase (GGDEF)-like protein